MVHWSPPSPALLRCPQPDATVRSRPVAVQPHPLVQLLVQYSSTASLIMDGMSTTMPT